MPDRSRFAARTAGLTTVEVVVALVILAVVMHGALALQLATIRGTNRARVQHRLSTAALSLLDSLSTAGCPIPAGSTRIAEGTMTWRVLPAPKVTTIDLYVTPTLGAAWAAQQVVPC